MILKYRKLNYSIHFLTENEKSRSRFRAKKEFVVGNCIDTVKNRSDEFDLNYFKNKYLAKSIIYIGRFSMHIKGLDILFNELVSNRQSILASGLKFEFYGPDCKYKQYLQNFSKRNGLTFITFHPEVYNEDKEYVFKQAMYNILTSRSEGFPMSVIESCNYGTPQILSSGTNIQQQAIEINAGLAFTSDFINKVCSINLDEYITMCNGSLQFANMHSFKTIGEQSLHHYLRAIVGPSNAIHNKEFTN